MELNDLNHTTVFLTHYWKLQFSKHSGRLAYDTVPPGTAGPLKLRTTHSATEHTTAEDRNTQKQRRINLTSYKFLQPFMFSKQINRSESCLATGSK